MKLVLLMQYCSVTFPSFPPSVSIDQAYKNLPISGKGVWCKAVWTGLHLLGVVPNLQCALMGIYSWTSLDAHCSQTGTESCFLIVDTLCVVEVHKYITFCDLAAEDPCFV